MQHNAMLTTPIYLLLLLISASIPINAQSIVAQLQLQPPRPSLPNSRHGFPSEVHLFEPEEATLPSFIHRLFRSSRDAPSIPFKSRIVSVDLLGGITRVGEYYTQVRIGGQRVRVQIDTGSSTMALPVAECDHCLPSDQRYNMKLSITGEARWIKCVNELCARDTCMARKCARCSASDACCADENPQACGFFLKYGDGSGARGGLMVDVMTWGNVSAPVIFGGILHDSLDFQRPRVDGILGMAYEALACNPTCVEPPFQQMVKAGVVEDVFSICITEQGGKLVLGEFDQSLAKTNITYVPLALSDPPTFYTMNVSNVLTIGSRDLRVPNLRAGILDSGTTLIVMSKDFFMMILEHLMKFHCDVPGLCGVERPWFLPTACIRSSEEIMSKLPTFTFHLGSHNEFKLELRPEDYMLQMQEVGKGAFRCVGIMAMDEMQEGTDIIFGNTVMQRYVSIYDRKRKRLGFAEAAEGCGGVAQCSANTQCIECATTPGCSYNFETQSCQEERSGLGIVPYPVCSGSMCFCRLGAEVGLVFGLVSGLFGSLLVLAVGVFVGVLYSRRGGRHVPETAGGEDRAPLYSVDDDEESFNGDMDGTKEYVAVGRE